MAHLPTPAIFICIARFAVGSASLIVPTTTLNLFRMKTGSPATVPTRLFGVRDFMLGGLLYSANSPEAVRRVLIAGAIVDGIDCISCALGVAQGDLDMNGGMLVGGGAVALLAVAALGLRNPGLAVKSAGIGGG